MVVQRLLEIVVIIDVDCWDHSSGEGLYNLVTLWEIWGKLLLTV